MSAAPPPTARPPGRARGRMLRRWYRAKYLTKTVPVELVERATGRVYTRRSRKRRRLLAHGRGFARVHDGPAIASQLARYVASLAHPHPPDDAEPTGQARGETPGVCQLGERSRVSLSWWVVGGGHRRRSASSLARRGPAVGCGAQRRTGPRAAIRTAPFVSRFLQPQSISELSPDEAR